MTLARWVLEKQHMNPPAIDLSALRKALGWLTEALMLWHAQPLAAPESAL